MKHDNKLANKERYSRNFYWNTIF